METYPAVGASLGRLRQDVRALADGLGVGARSAMVAQAASEAAANAIVHGHGGGDDAAEIEIELARSGTGWVLTVGDRGGGFRPSSNSVGLGVGLALIAQLADELELRDRTGGGTLVWMRWLTAA